MSLVLVPITAPPLGGDALAEATHVALLLGTIGCYLLWQTDREHA